MRYSPDKEGKAMTMQDQYDDETKAPLAELNARGVTLPMTWAGLRPETVRFNALQMLKAMPPRVRILHHRDPDESCEIIVYLDGKKLASFDEDDVDPGRGYDRSDYRERLAALGDDDSDYARDLREALYAALESQYTTGDKADDICLSCEEPRQDHADPALFDDTCPNKET